jgi:hypothetical protein
MAPGFWAAAFGVALAAAAPAMADEAPKYGGILTYMIPADAPPSFDAHREGTFATVHSAAPFYSVLIRVDPNNPSSTTHVVCDLCAAVPQPTDNGRTYTFKIRDGVKFHDGAPLTALVMLGVGGAEPRCSAAPFAPVVERRADPLRTRVPEIAAVAIAPAGALGQWRRHSSGQTPARPAGIPAMG